MRESIGRYSILRPLGSGGMGDVFAAADPELDRVVALKVLRPDLAERPDLVKRFEREARAIAALEHPNIVSIHTVECTDGVRFLTMEFVDGESLDALLSRRRPTLRELFEIAIPLADAISSAHERGVTHRDLKPANVMVSKEGRVKILDFGLAKKVVDEPRTDTTRGCDDTLTSAGTVIGTVSYMSPEQAEGRVLDHRTDIFSLGVILYELATGERPFRGETKISVLSAIIRDTPPPITEVDRNLPRHLDRIIRLALEKDREYRFQSAKDLRNELEQLRRELTSASSRPAGEASVPRRRPGGRAVALGLLAALGLGAALGHFLAPEEPRPIEIGALRRVTGDPGLEVHPAISPDGRMVVYAAGPPGARTLYTRSVTGSSPVSLTEELGGTHEWPIWSPDGSQIVFVEAGAKCWSVSPLGGGLRVIEGVEPGQGMAFSPSGDRIAYARGGKLMTFRFSDGRREEIVAMLHPHSPSWSPDGSLIAFSSGNPQFAHNSDQLANIAEASIWVVPSGGGEAVQVVDERMNVNPVWRGDRELLFLSNRDGSRDIYSIRIARDGRSSGPPRRLTTGLDVHSFSISADGGRVACSRFTTRANVWSLPVPGAGRIASSDEAEPVTHGEQSIEGLSVDPDETVLLFDSDASGNQDIHRLDLPDGPPRQLTFHPRDDFLPVASPDGTEIAFYSFRTGNRELFIMGPDGSSPRQVTDHPAQDRYPWWSPEGDRLVFYSDRTGREELWVTTRSGRSGEWSQPEQWTTAGGKYGRWSPDGTSLLFSTPDGHLWLMPGSGGEPRSLLPEGFDLVGQAFPNWSTDGATIYFKGTHRDGRARIWSLPASGGDPVECVVFDTESGRQEFAVGARRFYFTFADQRSDIYTIDLE